MDHDGPEATRDARWRDHQAPGPDREPPFRDPDVAARTSEIRRRIVALLTGRDELPARLPGGHFSIVGCEVARHDALIILGAPDPFARLRVHGLGSAGKLASLTSLAPRRPGQVVQVTVEPLHDAARRLSRQLGAIAVAIEKRVDAALWADASEHIDELRRLPDLVKLWAFRHVIPGGPRPQGMVRTGFLCNQDCGFCWQSREWTTFGSAQILTWIEDLRAAGVDDLVISGGEPTLDSALDQYIRRAKELGFGNVSIETNAINFMKDGYAERLRDAGLDGALISLHSPDAAVSDAATRAPGTHVRTVAGIGRLLDAGVVVILNCLLTPLTLTTLAAMPAFLARSFGGRPGLRQVIFSVPSAPFDAALLPEIVPDPRQVREVLPGVIDEALRLGLPVSGLDTPCGPPLCTFGADPRVVTLTHVPGRITFREHAPACRGCAVNFACFGPRREHIQLFGDAWLTPLREIPTRAP